MEGYAQSGSSLPRDSVALITATICAKALEDNVVSSRSQCEKKCPLLLGLKTQKELADLTGIVKKLIRMNKFKTDSFKQKYFEMVSKC